MTEAIAKAQWVMDEQGFLIASSRGPRTVGDVIPMLSCGGPFGPTIPGPLIVVGFASLEEWQLQQRKFGVPCDGSPDCVYIKVLAE